jgi:hypothetical protein
MCGQGRCVPTWAWSHMRGHSRLLPARTHLSQELPCRRRVVPVLGTFPWRSREGMWVLGVPHSGVGQGLFLWVCVRPCSAFEVSGPGCEDTRGIPVGSRRGTRVYWRHWLEPQCRSLLLCVRPSKCPTGVLDPGVRAPGSSGRDRRARKGCAPVPYTSCPSSRHVR